MDGMDRLFVAFIAFGIIDLIGVYISAVNVVRCVKIFEEGLGVKKAPQCHGVDVEVCACPECTADAGGHV